jgi:hypothetical protein
MAGSWETTFGWVQQLDETDQRIVLVNLKNQVAKNLEETVYPNINNTPKNLMWALKINAEAENMLATLASKATDLAELSRERTKLLTEVMRGERTLAEYSKAIVSQKERLRTIVDGIKSDDADRRCQVASHW